ncbi:MurR/RpiR family transcriptional regulator [Nocardioides sp. NPDC127503]|uniref:MurR/RpiR family transcriptional regulator n=1 Tax=Nocardioides sp. NPDC127503 TaxID=3154516 RepID=UPI003319D8C5
MTSNAPLHERIAAVSLTATEARVASFMAVNPALVAVSSTAEVGRFTETSDATVVRTAKKLGYSSFRELRRSALDVSGRHRDPSKVLDDQIHQIDGTDSGASIVLRDTSDLLARLDDSLDREAWNMAVSELTKAPRVITFGIGPSGCIADYLAISLQRIGKPSLSVKTTGFRLADDLLGMCPTDALVLFVPLRRFREIDVLLSHAREVGASTIVVSETLGESLRSTADIVLSTPQSTTGTSDGVIAGMVLAHALELAVASQDQQGAVQSMQRLNTLRSSIVGGELEADTQPPAESR